MNVFRVQSLVSLLLLTFCLSVAADAQQAAPFRSVTHPYRDTPLPAGGYSDQPSRVFGNYMFLTVTDGNTAWYSADVNNVLCSLSLPGRTWLGTAFGIKRLDLLPHTTRHYTPLDGLPYARISALASSSDTIFCASVRQNAPLALQEAQGLPANVLTLPYDDAVALCRLDPNTGLWSVLAEARQSEAKQTPAMQVEDQSDAARAAQLETSETKFMPRQWITATASAVCLIPGPCEPGRTAALIFHPKDSAIERITSPDFLRERLIITAAQMDETNLWLGTRRGLLRYDLKTKRWETLLPDAMIFGGVREPGNGLWVLTRSAGPFEKDMEQGMTRAVHWSAVHFAPGQQPRSYPVKERREAQNEWQGGILENITLGDNKVWMTVNQPLAWGHMQMAYLPDVFSLDPQTGTVKVEASWPGSSSGYAALPQSVLANSHTGWGVLTPLAMSDRFPGWKCEEDAKSSALLQPPYDWPDTRDAQGRVWMFQGMGGSKRSGMFLVRQTAGSSKEEADEDYHAPPPTTFPVHDGASFPVVFGDKVYFLSGGGYGARLFCWDRKTGDAAPVTWVNDAFKAYGAKSLKELKMLSGTDCLWIGNGEAVLRCDLNSRSVQVWHGDISKPQSYAPNYDLLGVESGMAWAKGASNHLYALDAAHLPDFTPIPLPPFPGDLERVRDKMILFALEDHIAWFTGQAFVALNDRPVIGYNLQTHAWTQPFEASLPFVTNGETLPAWRQGQTCWFPAWSKQASAYGYDASRSQWTTLPPITPNKNYTLQIAAIDDQNAWLTDTQQLYHLDRARGVWDTVTLPFYLSGYQSEGSGRGGANLYIAASNGVWAYDTAAKQMTQSPAVAVASDKVNYRVMSVDTKAVWMEVGGSGSNFVGRFDRASGAWKYWSANDGLPSHSGSLTGDGQSCWMLSGGLAYHLDPKTDRWENVSRQLAALENKGVDNGKFVPVQQALADGNDVWLVPGVPWTPGIAPALPPDTPLSPSRPLYRYGIDSGKITPVEPASGKTLAPQWLTASAHSLLLASAQGVYRLDRASGQWQSVPLPPLPAGFPASAPYAAREVTDKSGTDIWLLGIKDARYGVATALRFRLTGQ